MENMKSAEERYWLVGGKKPIPHLTEAGYRFACEQSRILDFYVLFLGSSQSKKSLEGQFPGVDANALISESKSLLEEMLLVKVVDNYLTYLSELLAIIYKSRPESLKSSETERLDFILQFSDMDELKNAIAEKRVERLSFMGLRELTEHLSKQIGLEFFECESDYSKACLLVEQRNIIVHNRSVVSNISAKRSPELRGLVGQKFEISYDYLKESRKFLEQSAIDIDVRSAEKYALPVMKMPAPPSHLVD